MPFVTATPGAPSKAKPSTDTRVEGKRIPSFYLKERTHFRTINNKTIIPSPRGISGLYTWYETDGVVFASVNGLSEAAVGQGYHTKIEDDSAEDEVKAKELVDEFGKEMNLDTFLPNVCKNMLIAGFCPVETKIHKFPAKSALKIIHPETVKEIVVNQDGTINKLIQDNPKAGKRNIVISGKNLTLFIHNQIANDLTGTSIISPIEVLLTTKRTAITNISKIIEKRMFPDIIWKTTRDPAGLSELLASKEVDEDLVLGWLEEGELKDVAQIVEIQGNTRYEGYIDHIDRLIYKGLYAPDLYFWKDATLASAKELTTIVDRNINAIQRNIERGVEAGFFQRLLDANGIEAEVKMIWGREVTGAEDLQLENVVATAIEVGLIGPKQLGLLLKKMGLDLGELGFEIPPDEEEPDEEPPDEEEPPEDEEEEEPVEDEEEQERLIE